MWVAYLHVQEALVGTPGEDSFHVGAGAVAVEVVASGKAAD